MTIGRSLDCDIVLDESGVSRMHARVRFAADGASLDDLGSTHGLVVNGTRSPSVLLAQGERVRIGDAAVALVAMDDLDQTIRSNLLEKEESAELELLETGKDLVLLVTRSAAQLDGTAELLRERGTTWLLHNVGLLPTSRLAPQELLAELIDVAERLPNFLYVRTLMRAEQEESLEHLQSVKTDPSALAWHQWAEITEAPSIPVPAPGVQLRAFQPTDAQWFDSVVHASFAPCEIDALRLTAKHLAAQAPGQSIMRTRLVSVALERGTAMAAAICDLALPGQELAAPDWLVRVMVSADGMSRPQAAAVLVAGLLNSAELKAAGVRVLVPQQLTPALAELVFMRGAIWVEAVAHRDFAPQITNVYACLA
jgi:hypothetical protein